MFLVWNREEKTDVRNGGLKEVWGRVDGDVSELTAQRCLNNSLGVEKGRGGGRTTYQTSLEAIRGAKDQKSSSTGISEEHFEGERQHAH